MPRRTKSTGRWVERAGATGGGRTYRGQAPVRWYASLALICLLGISLLVYSRYERAHATTTGNTLGSTWYSALAFDVCGKLQPNLPANPTNAKNPTVPQIVTEGDGIVRAASSTKRADATLGKFVAGYSGLELTSDVVKLPGHKAYTSGAKCPKGTPEAGQVAFVQVRMWPTFFGAKSSQSVSVSNPSTLALANGQEITVAYVHQGAAIPKPAGSVITTLANLFSGVSTSTTVPISVSTVPTSASTTTPTNSASTTIAPNTTTTKP